MTRLLARRPWLTPVVTFVVSLSAAAFVVACLSIAGGCGGSTWQKAASVTAIAAIEVDRAATDTYRRIANSELERAEEDGDTLEDWCGAVAEPWRVALRIDCAAVALADLAIGAQAILDADSTPGAEWAGAACGALSAVESAWGAASKPPAALSTARALVCALAGDREAPAPECPLDEPPPGCEGVL